MRRPKAAWFIAGASAFGFGALVAVGPSSGANALLVILASLVFGAIGWVMRTDADASWLPRWVVLGFLAKLVGTYARHWMVTAYYGVGDSYRYYQAGVDIAAQFRIGRIPEFPEGGAFGTHILEYFTGGLFTIFTPDMLGGFLMFSMFAFAGQLMFYAAFRHWGQRHQLKVYAMLIFLLPTYMFWPSSIGKDAIVVFALGGAAYFASRTLESFEVRWLPGLVAFLVILGLIRIHVAGLVVGALVVAGILAKLTSGVDPIARVRRIIFVGAGLGAALVVVTVFPDIFGVDLTTEQGVEAFATDVVRRTSGGTTADGGAVTGPGDIPQAIALVLFRPYAFEATELQHFFAAAETSAILGLTLWKLPSMLRSRRKWRSSGYLVFCSFYVIGFAIAFSVIRNLGIIARQRGQVLAFFLVVVVAMGWEERRESRPQIPIATPQAEISA